MPPDSLKGPEEPRGAVAVQEVHVLAKPHLQPAGMTASTPMTSKGTLLGSHCARISVHTGLRQVGLHCTLSATQTPLACPSAGRMQHTSATACTSSNAQTSCQGCTAARGPILTSFV
jgi:hypothetical protein